MERIQAEKARREAQIAERTSVGEASESDEDDDRDRPSAAPYERR